LVKIQQLCACGCGQTPEFDKHYRQNKFVKGHYKGEVNHKWKSGEIKHSNGYILQYAPENRLSNHQGYAMQHRLIWEKYNKASLLPWADVHHINGNKTDNRIENLIAMARKLHGKITHPIVDKSNRSCFQCKSKTTGINKYRNNEPVWLAHPITKVKWLCKSCYQKIYWRMYQSG